MPSSIEQGSGLARFQYDVSGTKIRDVLLPAKNTVEIYSGSGFFLLPGESLLIRYPTVFGNYVFSEFDFDEI